MIIYRAYCLESHKSYIGVTTHSLSHRISQHLHEAHRNRRPSVFHKAIQKYGPESLVWETLATLHSIDSLFAMESFFITKFHTLIPHGYNMTTGGEGPCGRSISLQQRKKLSIKLKERWRLPTVAMRMGKIKVAQIKKSRPIISDAQWEKILSRVSYLTGAEVN